MYCLVVYTSGQTITEMGDRVFNTLDRLLTGYSYTADYSLI